MKKRLVVEKFKAMHFRGLNNLELDDFSKINVFVGANNSGKTSLLEALKLMSTPDNMGPGCANRITESAG